MSRRLVKRPAQSAAKLIRRERATLVRALISGNGSPRENRFNDSCEMFERRVGEGLDLLASYLEGDVSAGALYAGQRMIEISKPELTADENLIAARKSIGDELEILQHFLSRALSENDLAEFQLSFQKATSAITAQATRHVRTLFVGDCVMAELSAFLLAPLAIERLSIDPFPINARTADQLVSILEKLPNKEFDAVFFSPFTHARLPEIDKLERISSAMMRTSRLQRHISSVIDQTKSLLDILSLRFECPIFVHNCSLIPRTQSRVKAEVTSLVMHRSSSYVRSRINKWITEYIAVLNAQRFQHVFLLNEDALAKQQGRKNAGRFIHASDFQHPTVLSRLLADEYFVRITTVADLLGRKLIICDLDNTLWHGLIGEGPVSHFKDRQATLKRLKDHGGIVLSIASKNDPANVHFKDGVLSRQDFVAPQISWKMKSEAILKIKQALNLQTKHVVFIDDRADERALIQEAFPDILVLDAGEEVTWRRMELWADLVHGASELNRTTLYQQKENREAATASFRADNAFTANPLKALGMVVSVREAKRADLKRAVELINRTNQWNLTGQRVTLDQIKAWHNSEQTLILIGSVADKFGDMGTVCVAVVTTETDRVEIPIFVLSCRVFGYGVETVMLDDIAIRCGISVSGVRLVGYYNPNGQNNPCSTMYLDHGFRKSTNCFEWTGSPAFPIVDWLEKHTD